MGYLRFLPQGRWCVQCYSCHLGTMRPQAGGEKKANTAGSGAAGLEEPGYSGAQRSQDLPPETLGEKNQNQPPLVEFLVTHSKRNLTDTPLPNRTHIKPMPNPGTSCPFLICLDWLFCCHDSPSIPLARAPLLVRQSLLHPEAC